MKIKGIRLESKIFKFKAIFFQQEPAEWLTNIDYYCHILDLFHWAEKEYNDAKACSIAKQNKELYLFMVSITPLHVLANSDEFQKNIIDLMDDNVWRVIPDVIKESLKQTYNIRQRRSVPIC